MDVRSIGTSFIVLAFFNCCFSLDQPRSSDSWSCSFEYDTCAWEVAKTEAAHPSGPLVDVGWRIFSPRARDELGSTLTTIESSKFVYLQSSSELRSELISPALNLTNLKKRVPGVLLSFSFFSFNGAKLSLYSLQNNSYHLAWFSTPADSVNQTEENSTRLQDSWIKVAQCLTHRNDLEYQKELKIAFAGHVLPNSSVGLRHVKALILDTGCAPDSDQEHEDQEEKPKEKLEVDDKVHVAWRFMIILSLFLCFGALFLATMIIVFGGAKNKITGRKEGWPRRRENQSQFDNPSFQFQYRRLDAV